jgi:hypothetical protein
MKYLQQILTLSFILMGTLNVSAQDPEIHVHTAVDSTIAGHISKIEVDGLDGFENMYPVFTHNYNPGGGAGIYQTHYTGIYYHNNNWRLYNEEFDPFITNSSFNVLIPGVGTYSWAHTTSKDNIVNNYTVVDHPKMNEDTNWQMYVSHNYRVGDKGGTYHAHNVGVFYSTSLKKWCIYNEDQEDMAEDVKFNVVFIPTDSKIDHMEQLTDGDNTSKHITRLDHPKLNNNPNAKIVVSHMYNLSRGFGGKYNDHPIGVYYNGSKWCIYNEDKEDMDLGIGFFVFIANDETTASTKKLNNMELPSFRVSPNPVVQGEHIAFGLFNELNEELTVEVVDLSGKVLMQKPLESRLVVLERLSTAEFTKGMYLLRVRSQRGYAVRRIIIQ